MKLGHDFAPKNLCAKNFIQAFGRYDTLSNFFFFIPKLEDIARLLAHLTRGYPQVRRFHAESGLAGKTCFP